MRLSNQTLGFEPHLCYLQALGPWAGLSELFGFICKLGGIMVLSLEVVGVTEQDDECKVGSTAPALY